MKKRLHYLLIGGASTLLLITSPSAAPSEPLKDGSDKANPDSEKVEDTNRKANPDAKELKDSNEKANPDSEKVEDNNRKANSDAEKVEDTDPQANPDARKLRDRNRKANPDAEELEDSDRRANPDARKLRDSNRKANADAEALRDSNRRKANPEAEILEKRDQKVREAREKIMRKKEEAAESVKEATETREEKREEEVARLREARERADAETLPDEPLPEGVDKAVVDEAESSVKEATAVVERELEAQKLEIKGEDQAQQVIREVLGSEGRLSRAERTRDDRMGIRRNFTRRNAESSESREEAVRFLSQRLLGQTELSAAPRFFRNPQVRDGRSVRAADVIVREPRYYHEGRRYLPYSSRSEIPAILLATAALDRIRIQPMREVAPVFRGIPEYETTLPAEYRREESQVISYPVNANTMISSNDILFRQGSTAFADEHSYEMLLALEETMKRSELRDETFVIEGHASAEGSFDDNLVLSQRRAEAIVRDLVRSGIDPSRLVPVGYGETEAENPADAPERLRQLDRRVVVVKLNEKPLAGR